MKIAEIFHNLKEKDVDNLRELEADIKSGKRPTVFNAGWTSRGHSWSDLENLGYAVSHSERGSSPTEMVSWWEYTGPEPVTLKTSGREQPEVIEAGYQTQKHTKDYG